jgi:hypothetical protein
MLRHISLTIRPLPLQLYSLGQLPEVTGSITAAASQPASVFNTTLCISPSLPTPAPLPSSLTLTAPSVTRLSHSLHHQSHVSHTHCTISHTSLTLTVPSVTRLSHSLHHQSHVSHTHCTISHTSLTLTEPSVTRLSHSLNHQVDNSSPSSRGAAAAGGGLWAASVTRLTTCSFAFNSAVAAGDSAGFSAATIEIDGPHAIGGSAFVLNLGQGSVIEDVTVESSSQLCGGWCLASASLFVAFANGSSVSHVTISNSQSSA